MKTRVSLFLVIILLAGFVSLPKGNAVNPPPDGGYPGFNTAEGTNALKNLSTGIGNTAAGWFSLFSNTDGSFNTAVGAGALLFNIGNQTTGDGLENTAIGTAALFNNITGQTNTANGALALFSNITGNNNTATGDRALLINTAGFSNTAVGSGALLNNETGSNNIAIGVQALGNNISGNNNIGLGNVTGPGVTTATNVICIGQVNGANVDSTTWISGIWNVNPQSGNTANVVVSDQGQLGVLPSSERFKKDIQPMTKASESILAFKPVTFRYKDQKNSTQQFGLIAEEVAAVNPDLVVRNKDGKPYSVRYDQVNAMLLNEFLKGHQRVRELEASVAKLQKQIDALVTGMEKVRLN
jgi:Chaperone of endosialidase